MVGTKERYITKNAVLLIVFNRPETTRKVFEQIRHARPPRLYLAADGPRPGRIGEEKLCEQCREIEGEIDWECNVETLFRDENHGSGVAVPSAVDWFFKTESQGIILEDDCLAGVDFFRFCDAMLERYKLDERVWCINGNNSGVPLPDVKESYVFSKYTSAWGWASWRRAWNLFERDPSSWAEVRNGDFLSQHSDGSMLFELHWRYIFDYGFSYNSWEYRWLLSCWKNSAVACIPIQNQISNIGFDKGATRTTDPNDSRSAIPLGRLPDTIVYSESVKASKTVDLYIEKYLHKINPYTIFRVFVATKYPWIRKIKRKLRN